MFLCKHSHCATLYFYYLDGKINLVSESGCESSDDFNSFMKKMKAKYEWDKLLYKEIKNKVDMFYSLYQIIKMIESKK